MNTNKYKNMMFLDADAGGGDGGGGESAGTGGPAASPGDVGVSRGAAAFEPVVKQTTGEPALPSKKPAEKTPGSGSSGAETRKGEDGEGKETPPVTPPSGFDPEKFANILGDKLKPLIEQRHEQKPPMSPEEARKLLKVWEPDDAWYAKYDNLETRKDAVAEMRDALVEQADVLAQARMQKALQDLRAEFQPHLEAVQRNEEAAREQRLHTEYPALKNPVLQPLITALVQDFAQRKQTFSNEKDLFKALANGVEAVLKVNNPEFKLETAGTSNGDGGRQGETNADRGGRAIPVTTPGGGGGTGRREGGTQPAKPRGIAVFDK